MARRVLSARLGPSLLLALSLSACRHEERAPAPSASASSLGSNFAERARERHFEDELARARLRWQGKPTLTECAAALKEKADLELCQSATRALAALALEPTPPPELALTRLAPGALSFVRLSERLRYLSLEEIAQRRVEPGPGATPGPSASTAATAAAPPRALPPGRKAQHSPHLEQRALEVGEGPLSQLLHVTIQLERDLLRNLASYLEYGPLPVRRAAFNTVKRLLDEHPQWPALVHVLDEAVVLEADADLKRDLRASAASAAPRRGRAVQSAETK